MVSNLDAKQFMRMVLDWMDDRGVYVPITLLQTNDGSWLCDIGSGTYSECICAQWWEDIPTQCSMVHFGDKQFEPTEQGVTEALTELTVRMEEGKCPK